MEALNKVRGIFAWVKDSLRDTTLSVIQFIHDLVLRIKNWILSFFDNNPIAEKVAESITVTLISAMGKFKDKLVGKFQSLNRPVKALLVILGLSILVGFGLLSFALFSKCVKIVCVHFNWKVPNFFKPKETSAEQLSEETAEFVACSLGCVGSTANKLKKACDFVTSIARGLQNAKWLIGVLIMLIPVAIKKALIMKFGDESDRILVDYPEWEVKSLALIRLQKIPSVLVSQEYYDKVKECVLVGRNFVSKITDVQRKSMAISLFGQLVKIEQNLERYRTGNCVRTEPFALHLSGKPGIGKSLITRPIIERVAGFSKNDIYERPMGQFWSGFVEAKAIVYDEFLVGNDEQFNNTIAREYLQLVSSSPFQPEMASVDDPTVGMKGTTASPKMVVSLNNTRYDNPGAVDKDAFQRRRKFVVHAQLKPNAYTKNDGSVDLSRYDEDEIANFVWLDFFLLPGVETNQLHRIARRTLTFDQLIEILKVHFDNHQDLAQMVVDNILAEPTDTKTPQEYINEAIRDLYSVSPVKSIISRLLGFVGMNETFVATGNGRKKGKKPLKKEPSPDIIPSSDSDEVELRPQRQEYHRTRRLGRRGPTKNKTQVTEEKETFYDAVATMGDLPTPKEDETDTQVRVVVIGRDYTVHLDDILYLDNHVKTFPGTLQEKARPFQPGDIVTVAWHLGKPIQDANVNYVSRIAATLNLLKPRTVESSPRVVIDQQPKKSVRQGLESDFTGHQPLPNLEYGDLYQWACDNDERYWVSVLSTPDALRLETKNHYGKIIMSAFGLAGLIYAYRRLTSSDEEVADEEFAAASEDVRIHHHAEHPYSKGDRGGRHKSNFKNRSFQKRMGFAASLGNEVELFFTDGFQGKGIAINPQWVVTFGHAGSPQVSAIKRGENITRVNPDAIEWYFFDEEDLCIFRIQETMQVKNIVKRFISESDLPKLSQFCVSIDLGRHVIESPGKICTPPKYVTNDGIKMQLERGVVYHGSTLKGDCGRMVTVTTGTHCGKYIGMVVAGTSGKRLQAGIATIITYEMLNDLIEYSNRQQPQPEFQATAYVELPKAPREEVPFPMTKTALKPSCLATELMDKGFQNLKQPSIKSKHDPRGPGLCPYEVYKSNLKKWVEHKEQFTVPQEVVDEIYQEMEEDHEESLKHPIGERHCTFEEALKGIPGLMKKLNLDTSSGYPHVFSARKRGKHDFVWFDEKGELNYTPELKTQVFDLIRKIEAGEDTGEYYWLGYLKDELVSQSKIDSARTRMIFCNCILHLIVFRMYFGFLIIDSNVSCGHSSMAMGINQYSYDMDTIVDYLSEVGPPNRIIAGDYKGFDMHHLQQFRMAAYRMNMRRARKRGVSKRMCDHFIKHEADSPIQVGYGDRVLAPFHFSGNFLTTLMNNQTREGYERYAFRELNPSLIFKEHIRVVGQGDDHIINSSPKCEFNGQQLKQIVEQKLGQEYTSADKSVPEVPKFQDISQTMFLGAQLREVNGRWTGAMIKPTLEGTLCWTTNNNDTILDEAEAMIGYASQWDEQYFHWYRKIVSDALQKRGIAPPKKTAYKSLQRIVAMRTVTDQCFYACGNSSSRKYQQFDSDIDTDPEMPPLEERPIAEDAVPMDYGTVKYDNPGFLEDDEIRQLQVQAERLAKLEEAYEEFTVDLDDLDNAMDESSSGSTLTHVTDTTVEDSEPQQKPQQQPKRSWFQKIKNFVVSPTQLGGKTSQDDLDRLKEELQNNQWWCCAHEGEVPDLTVDEQRQSLIQLVEPQFESDVYHYKQDKTQVTDLTLKEVIVWLCRLYYHIVIQGFVMLICDARIRAILMWCMYYLVRALAFKWMYYWFILNYLPLVTIAVVWKWVKRVPFLDFYLRALYWNALLTPGVSIYQTTVTLIACKGDTQLYKTALAFLYEHNYVFKPDDSWYHRAFKIFNIVCGPVSRIYWYLNVVAATYLDNYVAWWRRMNWERENGLNAFAPENLEPLAERKTEMITVTPIPLKNGMRMRVIKGTKSKGFLVKRQARRHYTAVSFEEMEEELCRMRGAAELNPENLDSQDGFVACSEATHSGRFDRGLTSFHTETEHSSDMPLSMDRGAMSVAEEAMSMEFGTNSWIFRDEITWNKNQGTQTLLKCEEVPFGLLKQGNTSNIQNMPFDRFVYWHGDVEVCYQLNGSPFQQGIVIAVFLPLACCEGGNVDFRPGFDNLTAFPHILLSPCRNTTGTLKIPFRYYRNVLNTYAKERIGTVTLVVLSPLKHGTSGEDTCTISWYTKFPNSKFTIPRPLTTTDEEDYVNLDRSGDIAQALRELEEEEEARELSPLASDEEYYYTSESSSDEFEACGNSNSTVYDHISGGTFTTENDASVDASVTTSAGMDNPAHVSNAIPVFGMFPGMAKVLGVEHTTGMQMKPHAMYTAGTGFDHRETELSFMTQQPYYTKNFTWSKTSVSGSSLLSFQLNSLLMDINHKYEQTLLTEIWNAFVFWKCDIQVTLLVARTSFHSGRLRATISYGAPTANTNYQSVTYNHIMNFTGDNDKQSFIIKYNAQTDYLRTWEGDVLNPVQDHSLGYLTFYVANQLRCPTTVSDDLDVIVLFSLTNTHFAVPRSVSLLGVGKTPTDRKQVVKLQFERLTRKKRKKFVACAGEAEEEPEGAQMDEPVQPVEVTNDEIPSRGPSDNDMSKIPFEVTSVLQLCRRYHPLPKKYVNFTLSQAGLNYASKDLDNGVIMTFPVYPYLPFNAHFAAWSGSLKYRIFLSQKIQPGSSAVKITFLPFSSSDAKFFLKTLADPVYWLDSALVQVNEDSGTHERLDATGLGISMQPLEILYSNSDQMYIDVMVPFQTHLNFCKTFISGELSNREYPYTPGFVLVQGLGAAIAKPEIFISAGDDFRYGLFRPCEGTSPVFVDNRPKGRRPITAFGVCFK